MIKSDVTYLNKPTGDVIFSCADSHYFKVFGKQLIFIMEFYGLVTIIAGNLLIMSANSQMIKLKN